MKVGDYIRTDDGLIGKVVSEPYEYKDSIGCDIDFGNNDVFNEYEMCQIIIKTSPNIIDLIEVGDLIRIEYYSLRYEERVTRLFEVAFKDKKYINLNNSKCDFMLIDGDFNKSDKELEPIIKSIVTKEQFSCMEYKIGE